MHRELTINREAIDEAQLVSRRQMAPHLGAALYFTGVVRDLEQSNPIAGIDYEAFSEMAQRQFGLIFDEVEQRWPIHAVRLVHRIGIVRVNEASLWLEVLAPHRGEAFAACQFIVEERKKRVPIWKRAIPKQI